MPFEPCDCFHSFSAARAAEWPLIGEKLLIRLTICFLDIST